MLTGKKVVLVDGSGYIFRAFYALPAMTRQDGVPVNAVYGFSSMMIKLLKDMPCDYLAIVFDAKRETFRQKIYTDYKATRKDVPEDLIPQFSILRQAVEAFNVAQVELEGFEADDLLATYGRMAQEQGAEVVIVSADKDLMQLVANGITLFDPMKNKKIDEAAVFEKFAVTPDKVVDVQALAGDASDNVPGVAGIGIKTAALLINEFGNLENLLDHASEIKQQKRRETLIEQKELARISKKLVTLDAFAPVVTPLEDFKVKARDTIKLKTFFWEQNFKSLADKISLLDQKQDQKTDQNQERPNAPVSCIEITTLHALKSFVNEAFLIGEVTLKAQTDSQKQMIGFRAYLGDKAYSVSFQEASQENQGNLFVEPKTTGLSKQDVVRVMIPLLTHKSVLKIGNNIKQEMHAFGVCIDPVDDVRVMSYDLDGAKVSHLIQDLARQYFNQELVCECDDVAVIARLNPVLHQRLVEEKMVSIYENYDRLMIPILYDMERLGIKVCATELNVLSMNFGQRIAKLEQQIYTLAGEEFNVNSPAQAGKILFDKLGLAHGAKNAKSKTYSTDASVLESLVEQGSEIAQRILEYRQFSKLKNTYTDALQTQINPKTKRVHTTFMQTITSTGRLSSVDPNLQNIPIRSEEGREIRRAFIASKGSVLLSADYSQIELRLLAKVASVKGLEEAFKAGIDIHTATASQVFHIPIQDIDPTIRRKAKAINFGIIYGISAFGLAKQLGISRSEAQEYITKYFERYPEIKTYMEKTIAFARTHGFVQTPFGRKCYVGNLNDKNSAKRAFAERSAINAPIQGGAADILKKAMIRLDQALKKESLNAKVLLQVHDELILEVSEAESESTQKIVKSVMESVYPDLSVELGVGLNWAVAH